MAYAVKHYLNKNADIARQGMQDGDEEEEVFPMPDEIW